jgi:CHAD domain-containing protein
VIVHNCLRHYRLNEPLLLERRDPEALHQCRVALRRLRSALSLFADLLQDEHSRRLRTALKHAASAFGSARNIDAFLAGARRRGDRGELGGLPGTAEFLSRMEAERATAYDRLFEYLNGVAPQRSGNATTRHLRSHKAVEAPSLPVQGGP